MSSASSVPLWTAAAERTRNLPYPVLLLILHRTLYLYAGPKLRVEVYRVPGTRYGAAFIHDPGSCRCASHSTEGDGKAATK